MYIMDITTARDIQVQSQQPINLCHEPLANTTVCLSREPASQFGLDNVVCINEHLWGEGAMKSIWNVMLEFDSCQWTFANVLCIQNHKFRAVGLGNIELYKDIAIIFITGFTASQTKTGNKDRLTDTAVGVPHLAMLMQHVVLRVQRK